MQTTILIILTIALAIVGGSGVYVLSGLLMNLVVLLGLVIFFARMLYLYNTFGMVGIGAEPHKWFVVLVYLGFLVFNMLKETLYDPEFIFSFNPEGGILREYIDLLRGFLAFVVTTFSFQLIKDHKILIPLPTICIAIVLLSQILEAYGVLVVNEAMEEAAKWQATSEDKLLSRPGGFLNANMTGAVVLIWLYVTLNSKLNTPVILKGLSLLLTFTVCLLAQSRGSILFLCLYLFYNIFITKNFKLLITILTSSIVLLIVLSYIDADFVNNLIERFAERATHKEDSAAEREYLIFRAIDEMQDTPIFGHELYHLAKIYGVSSHNQTLEILNNFGLFGFVTYFLFYLTFYHVNNPQYLILCVFPMLLFSHNFFENSAFQVALGFGYVTARANISKAGR